MSLDITAILRDWPYEPGKITARRVHGDDGRDKIQLRLDLGLYQMEAVGRPDGVRPHDCESLLVYHERRFLAYRREHGTNEGFELDEADCEQLRAEAVMYYHRYLAEFILEDYAAVQRDTARNTRAMDLCGRYAKEESDRFLLEQYRPYVVMMSARAKALSAFQENRPKVALAALKEGIGKIEDFHTRFGPENGVANSSELAILRAMAKEIQARIPEDPLRRLRRELAKAVKEERYEDAASLRDQIRSARQPGGGDEMQV